MKTSGSWKTTIFQRRAQPGNPANPQRKARRLPESLQNTWREPGFCQSAEHQNLNTSYGSGGIPEAGKSFSNAIPSLATRKTPGESHTFCQADCGKPTISLAKDWHKPGGGAQESPMFRSPPPDFHPAKARLLPRLLPGEKRSECPGNPTNTRRKPSFLPGKCWFSGPE